MPSNASGSSSHDSIEVFTSQTQHRTRSNVWEHFEPNLVKVDGELNAICKYCGIHLNTKSSTSSLRGHKIRICFQFRGKDSWRS
ncbi:hypothetical protein PVAP13_3KG241627 [Panicum virgatum]|uniref:BED-type domain-containing protein n=1 Tax=Panicum virgatum TaxID=38727 RepID=A0A8T0V3G8_PANVG|nr:hypothetical protein PVAP13_3KG241627 [Panicum virgatum]